VSVPMENAHNALSPGEAAEILGTDTRMLRRWHKLGAFPGSTFYPSGSQYDVADVERVLRELTMVNEGFEQLQEVAGITFEDRSSWLSIRQVAGVLDVSLRTAARWLESNLLLYRRGVPLCVPSEIRRVSSAYCDGLLAFAEGREINPSLLTDYRDRCVEQGAIV